MFVGSSCGGRRAFNQLAWSGPATKKAAASQAWQSRQQPEQQQASNWQTLADGPTGRLCLNQRARCSLPTQRGAVSRPWPRRAGHRPVCSLLLPSHGR
jgi:hypothetical protein